MLNVVLAGPYPEGTFEKLRVMLPKEQFLVKAVDTQEAYDAITDAEIMILRIFNASREVMERNPRLKMILRWGAGYDSVDTGCGRTGHPGYKYSWRQRRCSLRAGCHADVGGEAQAVVSYRMSLPWPVE